MGQDDSLDDQDTDRGSGHVPGSSAGLIETMSLVLAALGGGGTPSAVAASFLRVAREIFGAEHAAVALIEDGDANVIAVDSIAVPAEVVLPSIPARDASPGLTAAPPAPRAIADLLIDPSASRIDRQYATEYGLRSGMWAPFHARGELRGAVALRGVGIGRFSAADAAFLSLLAQPLAIGLDRARAIAALSESEARYRSLVSHADGLLIVVDAESGQVVEFNEYAATALGYPTAAAGLPLYRLLGASPAAATEYLAALEAAGEAPPHDRQLIRADGSSLEIEAVASVVRLGERPHVLILARDISRRRLLERQLAQAQKMESLGNMAGAVAHDFNNLLTTILGFAGLVKRSASLAPMDLENLDMIEQAARQAATLTNQLLAFARGGIVEFSSVDLRTVVTDTLRLAGPALRPGISIEFDVPGKPVMIEGDPGQVQQAIVNILLNARDAMDGHGSVALRLRAARGEAELTISDTGPGMDEATRLRVFEPFFTTKAPDSGLGLAAAYGVIHAHRGTIVVDSAPGEGAAFIIRLPLAPPTA